MNYLLTSLFAVLLSCFPLIAQEDYFLSPQSKAYLYHTVRKSPILEQNIGRYIVYQGEEITLPNGEINYDSTEQKIINQPDLLMIYAHDISRSPKGLLAELANKMAIWELNKLLQSNRNNSLIKDGNATDYEKFEQLFLSKLPPQAKKEKRDEIVIVKRIEKFTNPTLTFKDKVAILDGFGSWTEIEKKQVIVAYNNAVNTFVSNRAQQIFTQLGGKADYFRNVLTAAGDGSTTSGLFEEREKDERGRWNKGLPKAVGLFPYEPYIGFKPDAKKKKPEILSNGSTIHNFEIAKEGKETNIHLDVWGYNSEKQTTVVIKREGKYYPLFGSSNTRFLSPDSAYGGGTTYYSLIHKLEQDIADLEDKISGRRGYDSRIKDLEGRKDDTNLEIEKKEKELNEIRYSTITTNHEKYKTDSKRKKRKKRQDEVVSAYNLLKDIEKKIRQLKLEKEQVLYKKSLLEKKVQEMYNAIGRKWVEYKEKDGYYLYEDSTTFNMLTQEFVFPPSKVEKEDKEYFDIRLLAMPMSHLSNNYDEVMLHINVTDATPLYTSNVQLQLNDLFEVDQYELKQDQLFTASDSIAVVEFFESLLDNKKDLNIIARGGGVGVKKNNRVVINYNPSELSNYPGDTQDERLAAKESSRFKDLRTTEVIIHIDRSIEMQVNSFTDPVQSNFKPENEDLLSTMNRNNLSGNQMLSTYRAYTTLKALKSELNVLAGKYLPRKEATKVIDRLNKAIDKSKITVGATSVKYKTFGK
ncbi:hypothetical protein [Brumimicrobium aurantiacum]|uniref:Uncharacterized protein n=1 Tax=Brumimicrobium aurantiacum TaxID=1737063 RepID=A0A3E1F0F9_9FLAO|nr:hypothetical protein [Brumimicrobium aurantiacum]RFC55197.1 hypothetical protein DXU93_05080 [Brumimicrobium aurantiacum]